MWIITMYHHCNDDCHAMPCHVLPRLATLHCATLCYRTILYTMPSYYDTALIHCNHDLKLKEVSKNQAKPKHAIQHPAMPYSTIRCNEHTIHNYMISCHSMCYHTCNDTLECANCPRSGRGRRTRGTSSRSPDGVSRYSRSLQSAARRFVARYGTTHPSVSYAVCNP